MTKHPEQLLDIKISSQQTELLNIRVRHRGTSLRTDTQAWPNRRSCIVTDLFVISFSNSNLTLNFFQIYQQDCGCWKTSQKQLDGFVCGSPVGPVAEVTGF